MDEKGVDLKTAFHWKNNPINQFEKNKLFVASQHFFFNCTTKLNSKKIEAKKKGYLLSVHVIPWPRDKPQILYFWVRRKSVIMILWCFGHTKNNLKRKQCETKVKSIHLQRNNEMKKKPTPSLCSSKKWTKDQKMCHLVVVVFSRAVYDTIFSFCLHENKFTATSTLSLPGCKMHNNNERQLIVTFLGERIEERKQVHFLRQNKFIMQRRCSILHPASNSHFLNLFPLICS